LSHEFSGSADALGRSAQARFGNDYSPEEAALGADADSGDFMLSSGESESAVPDVSGTSPVLSTEDTDDAAAGTLAVLAGNGGMLAGRAGIGGATGI
jgi:hypothetical protein